MTWSCLDWIDLVIDDLAKVISRLRVRNRGGVEGTGKQPLSFLFRFAVIVITSFVRSSSIYLWCGAGREGTEGMERRRGHERSTSTSIQGPDVLIVLPVYFRDQTPLWFHVLNINATYLMAWWRCRYDYQPPWLTSTTRTVKSTFRTYVPLFSFGYFISFITLSHKIVGSIHLVIQVPPHFTPPCLLTCTRSDHLPLSWISFWAGQHDFLTLNSCFALLFHLFIC